MSDIDYYDDEGERTPLQEAMDAINALCDAFDIPALTHIIGKSLHRLEMAEAEILCDFVKAKTGMSTTAARALLRGAKCYREGHGTLQTPRQVANAYLSLLDSDYGQVVFTGSSLYVYEDVTVPPDDEIEGGADEGFFERVPFDALEKDLVETFDDLPLLRSSAGRKEVLSQLRLMRGQDDFFVDARSGVNLKNGFLHLDGDGQLHLLPHAPEHKARLRLEAAYDSAANFNWLEAAFARTLPDFAARLALQEVAGSILFGIKPARDNVRGMFLLWGASGSGKSTIIEMLVRLLPREVVGSVPPEHWNDPIFRASLENLLLNVVTELGGTVRIRGDQMKKIVSGEPTTGRRMRNDPFSFTPVAKHLFATNELPRILDKTDAFARRILVLHFPETLVGDQVDTGFIDKVDADPNALIAFAAAGAARLMRQGAFTTPSSHHLAVAEMQYGNDPAELFAHTQVEQAPGCRITTIELRSALKTFYDERGFEQSSINDQTIAKVVGVLQNKCGATRHKSNGQPFYKGVALTRADCPRDDGALQVDLNDL